MKREDFNKIINGLSRSNITDEDIEFLANALGVEDEDDVKVRTIESIITLASTNKDLITKYGVFIEEYYKLPIENRKNVCKTAYKSFIKNGDISMINISSFIVKEVEDIEEENAINAVKNPKKELVRAIQRNINRKSERPNIDFTGCIDE